MIKEQTTHGWKVLTEDGNKELGFFNEEKDADKFIEDEKNEDKHITNRKIELIFKECGIDGDISFDESDVDFWKRKLVEVYERFFEQMKERTAKLGFPISCVPYSEAAMDAKIAGTRVYFRLKPNSRVFEVRKENENNFWGVFTAGELGLKEVNK